MSQGTTQVHGRGRRGARRAADRAAGAEPGRRRLVAVGVALSLAAALVLTDFPAAGSQGAGTALGAAPRPTVAPGAPAGAEAPSAPAESRGSGFAPSTQAAALELYQDLYLSENDRGIGWTGSIGGCSPGTTTASFKAGVLRRINYFRAMAGVPDDITFTADYNNRAQRAALMMAANQQLNHEPPTTWRCYTATGDAAAGDSNLSLGRYGAASIATFMRDPGSGNSAAGHRRWLLHPPTRNMGTGDVTGSTITSTANALFVFDSHIFDPVPPVRDGFVAWPPPGFVPDTVVYPRWSFGRDGANFSRATVTMTRDGSAVPVTRYAPVTGYGINTLVWDPQTTTEGRPGTYHVRIGGVVVGGATRTFEYDINVFDPDVPLPPVTIRSPESGATIARGARVLADYSCALPGLVSCIGPVADGAAIDTSTLGAHRFTVTATDSAANQQTATHRYTVVDATRPTVTVTTPPADASYVQGQAVTAGYACADEAGGSGLASCVGTVADGAALNTGTLGASRPFSVTATDVAGNERTVDRPYAVTQRPDALIAPTGATAPTGGDVYAATATAAQAVAADVARGTVGTFDVTVQNDGGAPASFLLEGVVTNGTGYRVTYRSGATDITNAVNAGTHSTGTLAPGASVVITVRVKAADAAPAGSTVKVDVAARNGSGPAARDVVRAKVSAIDAAP